ncbi:MAG: hypothetical protein U5L09_09180 [Bacteroidales bacterium]|nr:hypothetical protein [Bacteroidales bacterium]
MPDNTEIDSVSYDSDWPVSAGKSMTLDPDSYSGDNNDPGNWYEAHTPYGDGDLGTPSEANDYSTLTSWNGSADSDWTNDSNWNNGVPTSSKDVSIPPDGGITIPSGKAAANCNNLTIQSDANGTGSLIIEGSLNVSGNSVIQRYIENDNSWHFLASPVLGYTIQPEFAPEESGGTLATDFDFYYFDETATDGYPWINLRASDNSLNESFESEFEVGKGYLVAYSSAYSTKHTFSGTINSGSQSINLSYTSAGGTGWNLIGNSFTASIDWSVVDKSNLEDNYFYIYDNSANGGAGGYVYHNGSNGSGTTKFISPGQGFFVKVASSGSIGISATELAHASQNYLKQEKKFDDYISDYH